MTSHRRWSASQLAAPRKRKLAQPPLYVAGLLFGAAIIGPPRAWLAPNSARESCVGKSASLGTDSSRVLLLGRTSRVARRSMETTSGSPEWHLGLVKTYSVKDGFGFITCTLAHQKYSSDVFLHKDQMAEGVQVSPGTVVAFTLHENAKGKPQARDVNKHFAGRVKSFNENAGYGFILCPEAQKAGFGDVFLHKDQREAAGANVGDTVTFSCQTSAKGQLQARDVKVEEKGGA